MWIFLIMFQINRYSAFACISLGDRELTAWPVGLLSDFQWKIGLLPTVSGTSCYGLMESYSGARLEPWRCWYNISRMMEASPDDISRIDIRMSIRLWILSNCSASCPPVLGHPRLSIWCPCRLTAPGSWVIISARQGPLVTCPPCSSSRCLYVTGFTSFLAVFPVCKHT